MAAGPLPRPAPAQTKPCYEIPELLPAWPCPAPNKPSAATRHRSCVCHTGKSHSPAPNTLAASRLLWASCLVWVLCDSSPSGTARVLPRWAVGASSRGDAALWIPAELGCTSRAYLGKVFAVPWC